MRATKKAFWPLTITIFVLVCLCLWYFGVHAADKNISYGMFEWDSDAIYAPDETLELIEILSIDRWYQQFPEEMESREVTDFAAAVSGSGTRLYALAGEADWAFEADGASFVAALSTVASYNASVTADERITGVMADIEPYTQPRFKEDPAGSMALYLSCMENGYAFARDHELTLIACIPYHYDDRGLTDELERLIDKYCDEVAVMNYCCGSEIPSIETEAVLAARYDKPLHCILEFQEPGVHDLTEDLTYRNKGIEAAKETWAQVEAAYPDHTHIRDYHWTRPIREMLEESGL